MYAVKILADSVSPEGVRLTTWEATFPRFILAELNTHRMLSRNSASSRAIPTEKLIERVQSNPFIPEFGRRVTGMGVGEPLTRDETLEAVTEWNIAREAALRAAESLLHVDKSRVNRLLEPFMWHTALISGTDWGNFFALRNHEAAQPEFRRLASMMQAEYDSNVPWECPPECWHLPLVSIEEMGHPIDYPYWKMVATGRCARVSYLTHDGRRDTAEDVALHNRLCQARPPHLSPFEHVARPFTASEWSAIEEQQAEIRLFYGPRHPKLAEQWCRQLEYCGNLRGWHTYRSEIPNEADASLLRGEECASTTQPQGSLSTTVQRIG